MALKTKKKFKLFDMNRDGKGVNPGEDRTPNLIFFFKQFGRKFTKILSLNILMIFQVLPLIACAYIYFIAMPKTPSLINPEYSAILGTQQFSTNVLGMLGVDFSSAQYPIPSYDARSERAHV